MRDGVAANHFRQVGFSMIEVLVTIVLISFGLLGVAAMQLTALKNTHSAEYRTQATVLAYDIIERTRANRKALAAGSYDLAIGSSPPSSGIVGSDLTTWRNVLGRRLPSGTGSLSYSAATGVLTVNIQWDDSRGSGGGTAQTFMIESQVCDVGSSSCQ